MKGNREVKESMRAFWTSSGNKIRNRLYLGTGQYSVVLGLGESSGLSLVEDNLSAALFLCRAFILPATMSR